MMIGLLIAGVVFLALFIAMGASDSKRHHDENNKHRKNQ